MSLAPRVPDVVGIVCPDHPGFQELRTRCKWCGFDPILPRSCSGLPRISPNADVGAFSIPKLQAQHDECELLGYVDKAA